jgi:hypothetical protein
MQKAEKNGQDKAINPPSDLLEGFKKKRDFILGLQSRGVSTDQCAKDLKNAFSPDPEKPSPAQSIADYSLNQIQKPVDNSPWDNLMPMASKYEHNSYLNIYSYFCKKQAKISKRDSDQK